MVDVVVVADVCNSLEKLVGRTVVVNFSKHVLGLTGLTMTRVETGLIFKQSGPSKHRQAGKQ